MITEEIINSVLQEKIGILVEGIVNEMPIPPQAIYLVGGYGRSEGAWYEDGAGVHPYNDFDLAVITDKPISPQKTEILRKDLAKKVGIKWVDIDFYSLSTLKSLKPTIHNIDLLEGGTLIYGDDVIKKNGLILNAQEIGKSDLITLYWTRMWTFLGSWDGQFHDLDVSESRFFKNQMAKAMLAACDMRLVKLQKYTTSYVERVKIINDCFKDDSNICELADWAIMEKQRPSYQAIGKIAMEQLYFDVKDEFIRAYKYSMGDDAMFFIDPYKTNKYYLWHTKIYLSFIKSVLTAKKTKVLRNLDVLYAMNYVFHANHKGNINEEMLKKASAILIRQGFINQTTSSWDKLRMLVADARNNI